VSIIVAAGAALTVRVSRLTSTRSDCHKIISVCRAHSNGDDHGDGDACSALSAPSVAAQSPLLLASTTSATTCSALGPGRCQARLTSSATPTMISWPAL
jgi:hypothetical protein